MIGVQGLRVSSWLDGEGFVSAPDWSAWLPARLWGRVCSTLRGDMSRHARACPGMPQHAWPCPDLSERNLNPSAVHLTLQNKVNQLHGNKSFLKWVIKKTMATHSGTLAWEIPWTQEPGRLQSMVLWRVGHDWATSLSLFTFMHWRRKWQPTPYYCLENPRNGSLVGCSLWGRPESDTTEVT